MAKFLCGFGFGYECRVGQDWQITLSLGVSATATHSALISVSPETPLMIDGARAFVTRMGVLGAPRHYTEILDVRIIGPKSAVRSLRDTILSFQH